MTANPMTSDRVAGRDLTEILSRAAGIFEEYLRKQNLKMTRERRDILRAVFGRDDHFTVDELVGDLHDQNRKGSRATLYRTLDLMVKCNLVDRHVFLDGKSVYERALGNEHHDHIMCIDCERLIEFHDAEIERLQEAICSRHKLKIADHVHKLYARCTDDTCQYRAGTP